MSVVQDLQTLLLIQVAVKGVIDMLLKCLLFVLKEMRVLILDSAVQSSLFIVP